MSLDSLVKQIQERRARNAIVRVQMRETKKGWTMSAYDGAGYLQSGTTVPSPKEYIDRKAAEWWPGVPIELVPLRKK